MHSLLNDFDLFIFDWDGTLSTSTLLVRISHFFKQRYNPAYIKAHADKYKQPKKADMPLRASEAKAADFLYELYGIVAKPRLREGAVELLEELKKHDKKIALFSDGAQHRVHSEIKRLGIDNYFDLVLSAETIHAYKPNPTGVTLIIKELNAKKSRSLYIGDMSIDIFTARFAGVPICAVGNGLDSYSQLSATRPDYLFKSTQALSKQLADPKSYDSFK